MEKYFVSEKTQLIMPVSYQRSKVIENYISYMVDKTPLEIINDSCKYYGSSFIGRCESTEFMIGVKYKSPIVISEVKEIIMFPTTSPKNAECVWINYQHIDKYFQDNEKEVSLILKNGQKYNIFSSNYIISHQIFKSSRLESVLRSKKR